MFRRSERQPADQAYSRHCPVVQDQSAEEEARLLDRGYHDVIAKPINPVRLVARVKHAMRLIYGDSPPPR